MTNKLPVGALTEERLASVRSRGQYYKAKKTKFYILEKNGGTEPEGGEWDSFYFNSSLHWYFDNYWHALAYSLQVKSRHEKSKA